MSIFFNDLCRIVTMISRLAYNTAKSLYMKIRVRFVRICQCEDMLNYPSRIVLIMISRLAIDLHLHQTLRICNIRPAKSLYMKIRVRICHCECM